MSVVDIPQLTYGGSALDMNQVGLLRRSDDALHDRDELHRRMGEDGYLSDRGLIPLPEDEYGEVLTAVENLANLEL